MNDDKNSKGLIKFFIGLGLFIFSGSTVLFVTDPYLMADISLVIISIYLMVKSLMTYKKTRKSIN
ncbi:MAG: hypothetical protein D4R63_03710 [Methylococcaceae bacterium]|nr:MAG: hypothetical protein D4R63_03710 [Methylococcaceae bacterium]